jgi:hypothetical protein
MGEKIGMGKQLYFLHIPKTAGKFISHNIKNSIDNDFLSYVSTYYPNNNEFLDSKIYISAHAGTYPIELLKNIDTATIVREPIEARASYFNFIYPRYLKNRPEYTSRKDNKEKFLYYLFEDKNFLSHNNYQSRFICNPADPKSWDPKAFYTKYGSEMMKKYHEGVGFDWFVGNEQTSLSNAIKNIDSFEIVNTVDNIKVFCGKIKDWFLLNHSIDINFDFNTKINVGPTELNKENVSSEYFVNLLTQNEKERILELNSIDLEVYNFVKNKENTNV